MKTAMILLFSLLLMLPRAKSQIEVSIGADTCCAGEVLLPVYVSQFNDIGAFSFYIEVDTAAIDFITVENINQELLEGSLESNINLSEQIITIVWFDMPPAYINSGKLFDMRLLLKKSPVTLIFGEDCEITFSDLSIAENVIYESGSLMNFGSLQVNPPTANVEAGNNTSFKLPPITGIAYQWQEKTTETDWADLNDGIYYKGVNENELIISSAPLDFNDHRYRCVLTSESCTEITDEAILQVTVGINDQISKGKKSLLQVYPNPAGDKITTIINGDNFQHAKLRLFEINGHVLLDKEIENISSGTRQTINLEKLAPGMYILQLISENSIMASVKILRNK